MKRLFQRGLLLVALTIGLAMHITAQSTQMTVHLNNGTEHTYYMSETDRVYFDDNETLVVEIAAYGKGILSDRYNLDDIRKITCAETESVVEASETKLSLSPNPVHDSFVLRNLNGKENLRIFSLDGKLVKSVEASESQIVDISDLPMGVYLVKTERQTLKMIKL